MDPRPPGRIRNVAFLGTLLALGLTLLVQACTQREVVGVVTGSVVVSPATASIQEGETIQLSAVVRDQDGDVLDGAVAEWTNLQPNIATVDQTGLVTGLLRGTATIRATHNGVVGTAEITVLQSAGISVSPISGPTTEGGGTATFTVVLESRPDADVTIALASSDSTEGRITSPASGTLTFTPDAWDAAQTVTVAGQNDDIADGNVAYSIVTDPAVSTDLRYEGLDGTDVQVTNNDNDTPGIAVSPVNKPTTEVGGVSTFTVVLTSEPTADVTIGLSSSDTTEAAVNVSSLTFTSTNWGVAQTVIVTGKNDPEADGNIDYFVVTAPAVSADPSYGGMDAADVAITNIDDETAGITVSPPTGPTREDGSQATFTVVLNAAPTGNVTVTIAMSSTNVGEGTISTPSIVFTPQNWNVAQTVTVTGQDDDVDDGDQPYTVIISPATSADPNYDGLDAPDVVMTNVDDETAGITVSPPNGPTTEGGGTASFTVVLSSEPLADVTLTFSSSNAAEATVLTGAVTFTSANWDVPRQIGVRGENDAVADGNVPYTVVIAPAASTDPLYNGLDAPDVPMTNVDDETPGITLSAPSGPTTEAGRTATFTVVLNTEPTTPVTIDLISSDPSEGVVSPTTLTFNPSGAGLWSTPRTVTVTGQNDAVDDGDVVFDIVTAPATSSDPDYSAMDPANVAITNIDDETAGITVSAVSGPTTEAGGTATFEVVLTSEPTANVTLAVASSDSTEGMVTVPASGTLTFAPSGPGIWSTPQQVTIRGQEDLTADGNIVYTIVTGPATSTDPAYDGLNANDVTVTNVDDEIPGITVTPVSGPTTEAGGQAAFTVVLNNMPAASVTIGISSSDLTEGTVSVSSLTFTTTDWNQPQLVTITGQNDAVDDDNVVFTIVTAPSVSTDTKYNGINAADVTVTNVDDDTAGVTVSAASGPTTEAGGTATFTIRLNSEPTANVTIGFTSSDLTEGTVSPAVVTFTPSGLTPWNVPQVVTVTGVNDAIDDDNVVFQIVTGAAGSTDPKYNGVNAPDVTFTNVDDDAAGIAVSPVSGPTTEAGGTASFTVVLNTAPSANVTVGISSSDPTEGTVPVGLQLTFTTTNWSTPQPVTITGQNDAVDDGDVTYTVLTAPATSTDPRYNGANAADVSVTNIDNDQASISVSPASGPTTEAGGTATFTVVLTSEPTANVSIALSSSDATEGTVTSPTPLTFTAASWSTAQTVTVTGVNDLVDDDNVVYTIETAPATSTDPLYNGMNAADVTMTNIDDENAGIVVSPISGPTTEGGGTATFTVVLSTAPTANVVIGLSSSDPTEGTVAPTSLTFTPGAGPNVWNVPQTVTVTGVNDAAQDGNIVYTIITAAGVSTDAGYSGLNAADVSVTNIDDETAGITVSAISGPTTEDGDAATFTIQLNSEPTADVTVGFTSSNANEGAVSPSSVTFTTANWSSARTVTVTGVNDDVDDGNIAFNIVTAASSSSDPLYDGIDPADVSVTNVDDDVAGVTVSAPTGPTTEEGGIAQFTVRLNSEPTGVVDIAVVTSDATEGVVTSPSPLQFDDTNWNVAQTVTVTGVDDEIDDDIVAYAIQMTATSPDASYHGIPVADVPMNNVDDADLAGINVTPTSGLVTTEGGGTASFSVVLNSEPTTNVSISLTSSDPTEGQVTSASPIVFTAADWDSPQTVTVTGQNDFIDDGTVAYTIVTAAATSADGKYNGRDAADVGASNQDDADTAGIIVSPTSGLITTESGGQATFTVVLNSEPTADVTIAISSSDTSEGTVAPAILSFTALAGGDAWSSPHTVTVTGVNDNLDDEDQAFSIITAASESSDPLYDDVVVDDVTATSVDIHAATLTINNVTVGEIADAQFTVTLSVPSTRTVTVAYATSNGTAVAGQDYTSTSGTLTFDPGETTQPIDVPVTNDVTDEATETFTVTLSNPSNATINDGSGSATITDEDPPPSLTIDDVSADEAADPQLTVTLSAASEQTVTVDYTTSNGSALAGSDYTASSGSVTFDPGETTQPITVAVGDDALDESDESFTVTLSSAVNATIADNSATVTINDNDPLPALAIGDATVTEGNTGSLNATFTVTLTPASGRTVTVQYATSDASATAGNDYTTRTGTLTFTAGDTSEQITVPVRGDVLDEDDETFTVTLTSPNNATLADATGTGTITDDDDPPTASIDDVAVGEAADVPFTVTLSAPSGRTVTLQYTTTDGSATAGSDYTAIATPQTLTFAPGQTSQPIDVVVADDALDEDAETFTVTLASPSNVTIADGSGTATITDNDNEPSVSIDDVTVGEADDVQFTATLSAASGRTVTIQYTTTNGTATAPGDYTEISTPQTLTFTPGETSRPIDVVVVDDALDEDDETFTVTLVNPSNASLGTATGTATITDDDQSTLAIDDVTITEGDAGNVNAVFTVTKTLDSSQSVQVGYSTGGGDATAGTDYTAASGTLTFAAGGPFTQTITVAVNGDEIDEVNETFQVTLSGSTGGAIISDDVGVGTITDDDTAGITVSAIDGPTIEGGESATFTVVLDSQPTASVSIDLSPSDPTEGLIVTATPLVFTAANWDDPQTVTVASVDDNVDDGNIVYMVETDPAVSLDPLYSGFDAADVSVTNVDDDTNGFTITESLGSTSMIEGTGADEVFVMLDAEPIGTVVLTITSGDTGEFTVSPGTLSFDSTNWNVARRVDLSGVTDNVKDGDQPVLLTASVDDALSDNAWDALSDETVTVTVLDID